MATPQQRSEAQHSRPGAFNYLDNSAEPSLYRNGKVLTRRDADGSDAKFVGVHPSSHTLEVIDARKLTGAQRKTCEVNGFELVDAPLADVSLDFFYHNQVVGTYYRDCERLVSAATGGRAFAFDHNIRSAVGKNSKQRITGGQSVQGPAKMVHGDYTLTSGLQRLRDLAKPPAVNDTLRSVLPEGQSLIDQAMVATALAAGGRFAIINVWRSIADEPVQMNPMAMCDGQTVQADATAPDGPCTFSFHSAFDDLSVPDDAPDRWSIEVRCLVIY